MRLSRPLFENLLCDCCCSEGEGLPPGPVPMKLGPNPGVCSAPWVPLMMMCADASAEDDVGYADALLMELLFRSSMKMLFASGRFVERARAILWPMKS